jgi:hypothetical protein
MGIVKSSSPPFGQTMLWFFGVLGVLGLVFTAGLTYYAVWQGSQKSAYDSAPICTSTAAISGCRFQGPARVVRTYNSKGTNAVDVAFDELNGRVDTGYIDGAYTSEWQSWQANSSLNAELWNGRLVQLADVKTEGNPDTYQVSGYTTAAWVSGAVSLALSALLLWWLPIHRRQAAERMARLAITSAEHPLATQQLPVTAEMTSYLEKEASLARHPVQVVVVILGAAAILPVVFSIVFILQNNLFQWGTAAIWAIFLGLGGLVALYVVHGVRQERRDLLGGVFVRSTGPFTVQVSQSRYGTSVRVVVGGRPLSGDARSLMSVDTGVGTVDYLPVSGDLIEVRDESGQVLWSRFAGAQSAAR